MPDVLKFIRIEQSLKQVREDPKYKLKPNALIEDFAEVLEDYRKCLQENKQLDDKVKELEGRLENMRRKYESH